MTTLDQTRDQGLKRRSLLLGTVFASCSAAMAGVGFFPRKAYALPPSDEDFLAVSKAITGKDNLDPVISARLFGAMQKVFPKYEEKIQALVTLVKTGGTPQEILARSGNLKQDFLALNSAWYMGSAENRINAPMVTYYDALMYKPTADGLPVPTYCFNRPGWWVDTPPPLGIPVKAPVPVSPPAPVPQGVSSKTPSQTPPLQPTPPKASPHSPLPQREH